MFFLFSIMSSVNDLPFPDSRTPAEISMTITDNLTSQINLAEELVSQIVTIINDPDNSLSNLRNLGENDFSKLLMKLNESKNMIKGFIMISKEAKQYIDKNVGT